MVSKYIYGAHAILLTYDVTNFQVSVGTKTDIHVHSLGTGCHDMTLNETQLCPWWLELSRSGRLDVIGSESVHTGRHAIPCYPCKQSRLDSYAHSTSSTAYWVCWLAQDAQVSKSGMTKLNPNTTVDMAICLMLVCAAFLFQPRQETMWLQHSTALWQT